LLLPLFMFMFCRSLFVNFTVFCWPMCSLSLFDLRILINLGIFHVRHFERNGGLNQILKRQTSRFNFVLSACCMRIADSCMAGVFCVCHLTWISTVTRLHWSYSLSKFTKEVFRVHSIFKTRHPLWSIVKRSVL
jgi:hypothetical protein